MIHNINACCLFLGLKNSRNIIISSIQIREISLDIMLTRKSLTIRKLMKGGPICLSVKNDKQFIMYQTISISLIHKSKYQKIILYFPKNRAFKKINANSIDYTRLNCI